MIEFVGKCLLIESKMRRVLVIGDLHLGYEEALNKTGIFVSRKMFDEMLVYFERVFRKVGKVDEVVLLGDIKHIFGNIMRQEWTDVLGLFDFLEERCGRVVAIKGNHDKILEPIAKQRDIAVKEYYIVGEFCLLHGDRDFVENYNKKIKYWVVGHGHPAVKIKEGVKVEKYKVFLKGKFKGKEIILVPSFFDYTIGVDPRENDLGYVWDFNLKGFEVWIVQDESLEVLNFGTLNNLK